MLHVHQIFSPVFSLPLERSACKISEINVFSGLLGTVTLGQRFVTRNSIAPLTAPHPPQKPTMDTSLGQWFSTRGDFAPQGTFGSAWKGLWLSQLGEVLLVSSEKRAGRLLNTPKTQSRPPSKELASPKGQLCRVERPCIRHTSVWGRLCVGTGGDVLVALSIQSLAFTCCHVTCLAWRWP